MTEHGDFISSTSKRGRPKTVEYEQFVEVWEQLQTEGRARKNIAQAILGGGTSTINSYVERYERTRTDKTIAVIKDIELPEAFKKMIADFKVKEIQVLEQENQELKARIDRYIEEQKKAGDELAKLKGDLEDAASNHAKEKQEINVRMAVIQDRASTIEEREKGHLVRLDELNQQLAGARQEAAVARKEIQMLREMLNTNKASDASTTKTKTA